MFAFVAGLFVLVFQY